MANVTVLITIKIPRSLRTMLAEKAKQNKRRVQDEFNKRLQASFSNPEMFDSLRTVLNPIVTQIYTDKNE